MSERISLSLDDLQVASYSTSVDQQAYSLPDGDISWPDVCTCIDICLPTEDIYCSGGCPPDTTM